MKEATYMVGSSVSSFETLMDIAIWMPERAVVNDDSGADMSYQGRDC